MFHPLPTRESLAELERPFAERLISEFSSETMLHANPETSAAPDAISIHGAREHNLKNLSVAIPRGKFVVVTGVSGSGKSTLAFDLIFAEGQRRFLDSMNAYARQFVEQMSRPDVDLITGIPPTVSIEQRNSRGGGKSTVATVTEIYHFLRLLFARLGTQHCPDCQVPVEAQTRDQVGRRLHVELKNRGELTVHSTERSCPKCGRSFEPLDPKNFSYNSSQGWCPKCRGFGELFYLPEDVDRGARADAIEESWWSWQEGNRETCPDCNGTRLNPVARAVRLRLVPLTPALSRESGRHSVATEKSSHDRLQET